MIIIINFIVDGPCVCVREYSMCIYVLDMLLTPGRVLCAVYFVSSA